ncbi:MAG: AAA family ATPase [Lachnospiraceae bacterium]|nr:AAA family ATPase [Lachnospiraceae bacterium]
MKDKEYFQLVTEYFPELNKEPYQTIEEQYHDWMQFVDMLCSMQIVIKENGLEESFRRIGTVYQDEELMRALEPRPFRLNTKWADVVLGVFQTLLYKGEAAANEGRFLPFDTLRMLHEFTYPEVMALVLSFMPDLNRKYERIYSILQEEPSESIRPTVGFVYDMCSLFMPMQYEDIALLSDEDSYIGRFVFDRHFFGRADQSTLSKRLCLNQRIRDFLMGNPGKMGKLYPYAHMILGGSEPDKLIAGEENVARVLELMGGLLMREERGVICLLGEPGVGKKFLINCLANLTGQSFLSVEVPLLLHMDYNERMDILHDIICKCMIEGLYLHLDHVSYDDAEKKPVKELLAFVQKYIAMLFVSAGQEELSEAATDATWMNVELVRPSASLQKEFWKHFLEEQEISRAPELDLDVIVSKYSLTPKMICQIANSLAIENVEQVDEWLLSDKIREKCKVNFGNKAKRLQTGFTWDDMELNPESEQELKKIIAYAKNRAVVYDNYGFGKKMPYGRGFSVLLYGPPGTGKTMAATVLANELKLDIYRIDLSQIGSKYIGETEKNLSTIFEIGKHANAILFFDEADALFTKRTEVGNSNDRYANAEIAYLLQKIEEYDGISFLATNNLNNFDAAFKRRITFIVPMHLPDAQIRKQLWEKVFPEEMPKDKIDFTIIAQNGEMSGSSIKSAALQAAYRAAWEKRPVSRMDIIDAIDGEYKKNGALSIRQELIRGKM